MIFDEIHNVYYSAVAKMLSEAVTGELTEPRARQIICETVSDESTEYILSAFGEERWQLMRGDMSTSMTKIPTMPMSLLEKRWLKSILCDERMALFDMHIDGLEGVEPLFRYDDFFVYDKYGGGDKFSDEGYIARFRLILDAIHKRYPLLFETVNRNGKNENTDGIPQKLEYAERDDKFRVTIMGAHEVTTLELGALTDCRRCTQKKAADSIMNVSPEHTVSPKKRSVTLLVTNERNALELVMLYFTHFEKTAERIEGGRYRIRINYNEDDEEELVIRILSFGTLVKVEAPQSFAELIRDRLIRQMRCYGGR